MGTRVHRDGPRAAGVAGRRRRVSASARRAAASASAAARASRRGHDAGQRRCTTAPTTIAVSCQNWNGKSWTSRSVAGSKVYEPPAKKIWWKISNSASKATNETTPPTRRTTISASAPSRTARQFCARSGRAAGDRDRRRRDDRQHRATREEADEHAAHVAHVPTLALVEHRRAGDRRHRSRAGRRRGRPGSRRSPPRSSGSREAGPGRGLGTALLEGDPHRVQEQRQRRRPRWRAPSRGRSATLAARPRSVSTAHRSPSARGPPDEGTCYSSSSVRACSHQPSIVRSVGGLLVQLDRRRQDAVAEDVGDRSRMSRSPSMPAWMSSW